MTKCTKLQFGKGFKVAISNPTAQAAQMVLKPGEKEGDPANKHKGADQWLFVHAGRGCITINGRKHLLFPGSLVLIERGDKHEIWNNGTTQLKTLNFYTPPAYTKAGDELPPGKRK